MKKYFILLLIVFYSINLFGQNILKERIWKIASRKRAIYVDEGVFHLTNGESKSTLMALRHSYNKTDKYERIVFDFNTKGIPSVYGYISKKKNKFYLDLFNVKVHSNITSFGNSVFVKDINFFPVTSKSLPIEISLKQNASLDIFYLTRKGRLVIDIRKK